MGVIDLGKLVHSELERVVALEYDGASGQAELFRRLPDGVVESIRLDFKPFVLVAGEALAGQLTGASSRETLGGGELHRELVTFSDAKSYDAGLKQLKSLSGHSASSALAPYRVFSDMWQQMLTQLRVRLFRGMQFHELRRLQLDIETHCGSDHHFCNADCPEDEVLLVSLKDNAGFEVCLSNKLEGGEAQLLRKMLSVIQERDPDVIEGHNIFNFDLSYLEKRCKRYKIPFALGRGGKVVKSRASRFTAGERQINYQRFDVYGRHVVDTYFLVILYDVAHRDLDSHGLKACAKYFGVAAPNRTYVEGGDISSMYETDPETLMAYCLDDVRETDGLSSILSPSYFYQAQLVPFSYQNCVCRGNATRIDALLCAEYLTQGLGLPVPQAPRQIQGALSESMVSGVFNNVWHIDVRSLYPSIIISEELTPSSDVEGVFLRLLRDLRSFRLQAKDGMKSAPEGEREHLDALQSSFKILINSFYGYTAFAQGTFNDYDLGGHITGRGREILSSMRDYLMSQGAVIIEMDTDGIYFTPPQGVESTDEMRARVQSILPKGIDVDLDSTYRSMFSYKAKNYALLGHDGKVKMAGAALKSRGLEPFQRRFMQEMIGLLLEGKADEVEGLYEKYVTAIENRSLPLSDFIQKEYLSISPQTYADKLAKGETRRSAAYELALASSRNYTQGEAVQFYIVGNKKKVVVTDSCRIYEDSEPEERLENVPYYLEKLKQLRIKFAEALE